MNELTPPWRASPWSRRTPSRSTASAARRPWLPPWRRTRCAGPPARRDNARNRSRRLPSPPARPASWRNRPARPASSEVIAGSTTFMHTEVLERIAGSFGQEIDPRRFRLPVGEHLGVGVGARHQGLEAADRLRPVQRVEIILDAQHRRRVDGLALEDAFVELAALGHAEDLRQRPGRLVALEPRHRARRQHQHAVRGLAAQRLLPGERHHIELWPVERLRERRRGRVADREAFAVGADPVGIGDAHARGGAVPGEDDVGGRDRPCSRSGISP